MSVDGEELQQLDLLGASVTSLSFQPPEPLIDGAVVNATFVVVNFADLVSVQTATFLVDFSPPECDELVVVPGSLLADGVPRPWLLPVQGRDRTGALVQVGVAVISFSVHWVRSL